MRRALLGALMWSTLAVACGECEHVDDPAASGGAEGAKAAKKGADEVTVEGYKLISAGQVDKAAVEAAAEGPAHSNLVMEPTSPDPHGGRYTIEEAVAGLGTDGTLVAEINTTLGTLFCDLFMEEAPATVANFIGLARGKRQWWDARAGTWIAKRYYNGLTFHRVIPDYVVQGGDYLGDGSGTVGYTLPNENADAGHGTAGLLCMADASKNGAQFLITDGAAPDLDGADSGHTVFGRCLQTDVVERLARVPQTGRPKYRPLTPLEIEWVNIRRVRGGAAKAKRTPPVAPPGMEGGPKGASPGPTPAHLH